MSHAVTISPEASAQLEDLFDYIASASSFDIARKFTDAILDQIEALCDFPHRGAGRDHVIPGLRILGFRKRVTIAYVVDENAVSVLGVFYGGQDFESLFRAD